jgi:hypothetical protein
MLLRTASIADTHKTQLHLLQRIAMTLTRMHAIGSRLSLWLRLIHDSGTTGRQLPVLLMVRNCASEVCCTTLPKLGCVRNKQEVYSRGNQSRGRYEPSSQSERRGP